MRTTIECAGLVPEHDVEETMSNTLEETIERAGRVLAFDQGVRRVPRVQGEDEASTREGDKARRVKAALKGAGAAYSLLRFDGDGEHNVATRVQSPEAVARGKSLFGSNRIVFVGQTRSGKTSLAAATLAERVARSGEDAEFFSCWDLAIARAHFKESEPDLVGRALSRRLVVLDDLSNGRDIPSSPIEDIIRHRHKNGMATWVTTWMTCDELGARYGGDIALRVYERAIIIECDTPKGPP